MVVKLAFLCIHLPFGTTTAPSEYTTISDAEINLGNDLLADALWDETDLHLPHIHLLPREEYLPASDPLVKSDKLAVNIKEKEDSMDEFIDDIININIDNPCWVERAEDAALLVIHIIFKLLNSDEPPT